MNVSATFLSTPRRRMLYFLFRQIPIESRICHQSCSFRYERDLQSTHGTATYRGASFAWAVAANRIPLFPKIAVLLRLAADGTKSNEKAVRLSRMLSIFRKSRVSERRGLADKNSRGQEIVFSSQGATPRRNAYVKAIAPEACVRGGPTLIFRYGATLFLF